VEARKAADTIELNTCRSPVRGCAQGGRHRWAAVLGCPIGGCRRSDEV